MGLMDALCSIGGAIVSGIKQVATGIVNICAGVAKTVGKYSKIMATACETVGAILSVVYPPLGVPLQTALKLASRAFRVIGIVYDALNPEETIEEIGERSLEAAGQGIVPENYDTWQEYSNAVRNTPLSEDRAKYSEDDRLVAGMAFVEEKLRWVDGLDPATIEVILRYEDFFTGERLEAWRAMAEEKSFRLSDIKDYFVDQSAASDRSRAYEFICEAERRFNPDFDEEALYGEILKHKQAIAGRVKMVETSQPAGAN